MSLQEVLKKYENNKRQRQKDMHSLRIQVEKGIEEASIQELKLQNHKVNHIHKNQQAIEVRLRKQQQLLTDLRRNQEIWASLYEQLNRALMQVGDLVHYAGYVQAEVGQIVGVATVAKFLQDAQKESESSHQAQSKIQQPQQKGSIENGSVYQQIVQAQEKPDFAV